MRRAMRTEWIRLRGNLVMFVITAAVLWGYWAMFGLAGLHDRFIEVGIVAVTGVAALGFVILPVRRYRRRAKQLAAQQVWTKAKSCT